MAVSLWLFCAHFPTFQPFAEVENVLVVANGLHGRLAFAFQGEVYQFVHKLVEAYAGGFPQVEREGTGNGVDFVDVDVAAFTVDHKIDTGDSVARQYPKRFAGKELYPCGIFGREVGGNTFLCGLHAFVGFASTHTEVR